MNKRFFTMMTAILLSGSLFCGSIYADVTGATSEDNNVVLKDGTKYYFTDNTTPTKFVTVTVVAASDDATYQVLTLGTPTSTPADAALLEIDETTIDNTVFVKLKSSAKNVANETVSGTVYLAAAGTAVVADTKANMQTAMKTAISNFKLSGQKYVTAGLAISTAGANFISTGAAGTAASTEQIIFMRPANDGISATDLNKNLGNAFSLKFTPEAATNVFSAGNIQAVTMNSKTYFKVAGEDFTTVDLTDKDEVAMFKAATFIALDTLALTADASSDFNGTSGMGYKFITVKGEDMITTDATSGLIDGSKLASGYANKRYAANAQFTVNNNVNNTDSLIITLASVKIPDAKKELKDHASATDLRVNVVNFAGVNYVTTFTTAKATAKACALIEFGSSSIVKQKELVGVYNITSLDKTSKTYGKVFGPTTSAVNETVDAKLVMFSKPEGQFIVTSSADGMFTFKNRESGEEYKANGLRKTAEGNYSVNGDTLKLVAATMGDKFDGFKNYSDKLELQKTAYTLAVYSPVTENVYLTEKHSADHLVGLSKDKANAVNWRLVKFEEKKTDEHANDSIISVSALSYLKDGKYTADKKDSVVILSYAIYNESNGEFLSYNSEKKAFYCNPALKTLDDARNAAASRFAIKEKGNGRYNLILVDGNATTTTTVALGDTKLYGAFSEEDGKVNQNSSTEGIYALTDNDLFVIEAVDAPKYRSVAAFDTVSIYKHGNEKISLYERGKFLGMQHMSDVKDMAAAMFVDTAFVRGNTNKPQYLLAVDAERIISKEDCQIPGHPTHKADTTYGRFLVNMVDSAYAYGFNKHDNPYTWENNQSYKLAFVSGFHTEDKLFIQRANNVVGDTIALGDNDDAIGKYAFRYVDRDAKSFIIETQTRNAAGKLAQGYIKWLNGTPAVVTELTQAEVFNMNEDEKGNPTANGDVVASEVSVIAGAGYVTVQNANGKKVTINNILGQTIANTVLTSDNATIAASAGVVIVAVEGEAAVKTVVR